MIELTKGLSSVITPFAHMKFNYNFLKLTSGCSLMWHFDTYATFVKFNGIEEENVHNVCRTVIMMNDWDRGQVLQVGNEVYTLDNVYQSKYSKLFDELNFAIEITN